jgi:hypothetical protein
MQHGQLSGAAGETARSAGQLPRDNTEGADSLGAAGGGSDGERSSLRICWWSSAAPEYAGGQGLPDVAQKVIFWRSQRLPCGSISTVIRLSP